MPTLISADVRHGKANCKAWRQQIQKHQAVIDDPEAAAIDKITARMRISQLSKRIAAYS